jgi:predicted dehydrogenase
MAKKVCVGVIGAGAIAPAHLKNYQAHPQVELLAVCDVVEAQANKVGAQFGIPNVFTDHKKMLKSVALDAVSVCTPNLYHAPQSIDALKAGLHVLCEKPLAMSAKEARQMVKTAEAAGKLLMTAQCMRYSGAAQSLKKMIDKGRFGELYFGKAMLLRRSGIPKGWFGSAEYSGGGPLLDIGVHVLDLMWYLMGQPKPVSAFGVTFDFLGKSGQGKGGWGVGWDPKPGDFSVEDLAAALIRFEDGKAISLEASWAAHTGDSFLVRVLGTKGGAQINPDLRLWEVDGGTSLDTTPNPPKIDGYQGEVDHFVDCIANGTKCTTPGSQSVLVVAMLDAIYESAKTGKLAAVKAE